MHPLLNPKAGRQERLLGNLAIVRGALEAGVAFVTCYPGTPSSEIPDTFFELAPETDVYFEYSTNEKVAMEVGAGAAAAGLRTPGHHEARRVKVAADPLMTLAYVGVEGGMVILTADDPSLFSSQNEQDNRYYAKLSRPAHAGAVHGRRSQGDDDQGLRPVRNPQAAGPVPHHHPRQSFAGAVTFGKMKPAGPSAVLKKRRSAR
jgi:hypothetical protein